ncbi:MAG: DUF5107 domain-containing protein [Bacteroidota bacterium]|nr:DUF5107 domain-containing protein [Bacteroidota bacterium]
MKILRITLYFCIYFSFYVSFSQNSIISEYSKELDTYNFSDPNPIPILLKNTKIYPYFTFDGYQINSTKEKFKVIELENDYVKVFVTPELGGKVWGAIEKSTGEEFIYRNEVVKFRNISMRGPWTSGGIEFNFGIIGHHPSTATPVDYIIQKNDDGSVSCTVGNIDLPSRTQWRVKITLPNNLSAFHTDALWYNPTPLQQSYYNWMTGAAPARDDLEFYTPGNIYLEHSGEEKNWPFNNDGKNLSKYNQNNFGPSKSYHVVGEYNDFFGGYYTKDDYGFGHWGNYEDIPGQKLWLWSQSRAGGIWEDLLTDTDGQYIEFQAGRLLVQFSPSEDENPITQVNFEPYVSDQWKEVWFPLKEIGGLKDASPYAAMNIEKTNDSLIIKINPFKHTHSELHVISDNKLYYTEEINLKPMDVFKTKLPYKSKNNFEVEIKDLDLHYVSDPNLNIIARPFTTDNKLKSQNTLEKLYLKAREDISYRQYIEAENKLIEIISKDPYHIEARSDLGELFYRKGEYIKGLEIINKGLSIDTYNPSLNYIAGIIYKATHDNINAKETFGWAARSIKYRSNAFSQMGDIFLKEKKYGKAIDYANKALKFNSENIPAMEILAIAYRKNNNSSDATTSLEKIYDLDPLHHIIPYEKYLTITNYENRELVINSHRSELAYQTYLELAISYYNRGLIDEAIKLLDLSPNQSINKIWESFLIKDKDKLKGVMQSSLVDFVFPFRRETIEVLKWADSIISDWKITYFLGLNLWGKNRIDEAIEKFISLKNVPNHSTFYLSRAHLLKNVKQIDPLKDLKKAYTLDASNWRVAKALANYYMSKEKNKDALGIIKKTYNQNKSNYIIGMDYVKTLIELKKYKTAVSSLNKLHILPYEHAGEGRDLYTNAYFGSTMEEINKKDYKKAINLINTSKEWPEQLGVGKPYNVDERIQDYLLFHCYSKLDNNKAEKYLKKVIDYSRSNIKNKSFSHSLGLKAIKKLEGIEASKKFSIQLLNSNHGSSEETKWIINNFFNTKGPINQELNQNFKIINEILMLN